MKIINRHTLETKDIPDWEKFEFVFTVSSEWVPYTAKDLHVLLRSRDEIINDDRKETKDMESALQFYADPATYDIQNLSDHGYIIIDKDNGKRARKALNMGEW